jgi:ribosomal protein L37AE/L43A
VITLDKKKGKAKSDASKVPDAEERKPYRSDDSEALSGKEGRDLESKRVTLLKKKSGRLECPVCGLRVRLRLKDGALICRDGGHITFPDGTVIMAGGVKTTLEELRERGVIKEKG